LLIEQLLANGVTTVFSFVMTTLIVTALKLTVGIRVSEESENAGLDIGEHGEPSYS
jgi:Amt family ammonium transporter